MDSFPDISIKTRNKLNIEYKDKGIKYLQEELKNVDPISFDNIDTENPRRLIRALEIYRETGQTFSSFKSNTKHGKFPFILIGLEINREELYKRIDLRVDQMINNGLVDEARALIDQKDLQALDTVGYKEIFPFLSGEYDLNEAIRLIKRNSRRYAKRQMTWLRRYQDINWINYRDTDKIISFVRNKIS